MLLMNVAGAVVLGVSMMYATTVGSEDAIASVMIEPEADQVKISIWPGVSIKIWLYERKPLTVRSLSNMRSRTEDRLTLLFPPSFLQSLVPDQTWW